jgi:hypothetical protein
MLSSRPRSRPDSGILPSVIAEPLPAIPFMAAISNWSISTPLCQLSFVLSVNCTSEKLNVL